MRKEFLKSLTNKQLECLEHSVHIEKMFREYQRKQRRLAKLPPLKSLFANLTDGEFAAILED